MIRDRASFSKKILIFKYTSGQNMHNDNIVYSVHLMSEVLEVKLTYMNASSAVLMGVTFTG